MALWTDLAQWRGPSPNRTKSGMNRYDGQVTHIAAGYYEGTIAWQLNDSSNISSHFVVGREWGQCAQLVDTVDAAWTQGEGNGEWISVENAGFLKSDPLWKPGWELLSPWQIECNAQLYARGHKEYGWPLQLTSHPTVKGLGYHGMGAENGYRWGHIACPGEAIKAQLPEVLARAIEIVNGDEMDQATQNTLTADTWRLLTVLTGLPAAEYQIPGEKSPRVEPNRLKEQLDRIELKPTTDPAAVAAALAADEAFVGKLATAIASKLGVTLEEIVDQELDEAFKGAVDAD